MSRPTVTGALALPGLVALPSQSFGALRLVPLARVRPADDLRLALREQAQDVTVVTLGRASYVSYIPHAVVARWTADGSPVAALGGQLVPPKRVSDVEGFRVQRLHRMARHEGSNAVRFLPMHLAMEHLLALCFGGPDIAWPEWSRRAIRDGLSPRVERSVAGTGVRGLDDALRQFEIHDGQVGVALFAADALATVFVTPHPEDYRLMHRSLIRDFFGALIAIYARLYDRVGDVAPSAAAFGAARDLAGLTAALDDVRAGWRSAATLLLSDVLGRPIRGERVQRLGAMALERFTTDLSPGADAHIGERITRADGEVLYLKTMRLSRPQTKRAFLLQQLAAHDWHLDRTAAALRASRGQLIERLIRADLGWMLHPTVRDSGVRR
jgi:hypothetical protein